jgi:hypothetical protein
MKDRKQGSEPPFVCGANRDAWAIGTPRRNGFQVRRIVWGRALARIEKRDGEQIRRARLLVRQAR